MCIRYNSQEEDMKVDLSTLKSLACPLNKKIHHQKDSNYPQGNLWFLTHLSQYTNIHFLELNKIIVCRKTSKQE
jgi:hypothetical protein